VLADEPSGALDSVNVVGGGTLTAVFSGQIPAVRFLAGGLYIPCRLAVLAGTRLVVARQRGRMADEAGLREGWTVAVLGPFLAGLSHGEDAQRDT
jgi:hypothetical protein